MSALFDAYYYGVENGEVNGPLPLESIRALVNRGDVPEWVMLSRTTVGPWAPLGLVIRLGDVAFEPEKKPKSAPVQKPLPSPEPVKPKSMATPSPKRKGASEPQRRGSVAGFYEILALICAALGSVNLGIGVYYAAIGDLLWWPCAVGAVVSFLLALGLRAISEVLYRLLEIVESVQALGEE